MDLDVILPSAILGLAGLVATLVCVSYAACLGLLIHKVMTLPLRRQERARQFLDILSIAVEDGRNPEQVLCEACADGQGSIHLHIHLLAAYVGQGAPLPSALRLVDNILPRPVQALLLSGIATGNLPRILPRARSLLESSNAALDVGLRGFQAILFTTALLGAALSPFLTIVMLPRFFAIMAEFSSTPRSNPIGAFTTYVAQHQFLLPVGFGLSLAILAGAFLFRYASSLVATPGLDLFRLLVPWHRHRVHRNFALLLGASLDAGLPEEHCVVAAAAATGNRAFERRCHQALTELRRGVPLHQAVARLDSNPAFLWRLRTALCTHGLASTALAGWVEELDAKAQNQQRLATQAFCTLVLALQAGLVASFSITIFHSLQGAITYFLDQ